MRGLVPPVVLGMIVCAGVLLYAYRRVISQHNRWVAGFSENPTPATSLSSCRCTMTAIHGDHTAKPCFFL